jgi:hypothetical protein
MFGAPDFCPGLCRLRVIFWGGVFADLLGIFVKNVVQGVVFGVVKMDMLW